MHTSQCFGNCILEHWLSIKVTPNQTTCDTLAAKLSDVKDSDFKLVLITIPTAHITVEKIHVLWVYSFCGASAGHQWPTLPGIPEGTLTMTLCSISNVLHVDFTVQYMSCH